MTLAPARPHVELLSDSGRCIATLLKTLSQSLSRAVELQRASASLTSASRSLAEGANTFVSLVSTRIYAAKNAKIARQQAVDGGAGGAGAKGGGASAAA